MQLTHLPEVSSVSDELRRLCKVKLVELPFWALKSTQQNLVPGWRASWSCPQYPYGSHRGNEEIFAKLRHAPVKPAKGSPILY
jgi:hypothetical protein